MDNDVRKTIALSPRQCADVELLRVGGYRPLEGFMCEAEYRSVLHHMHLPDGEPWPMPITLAMGPDGSEHNIVAVSYTHLRAHET